jgi:hypothetical protein
MPADRVVRPKLKPGRFDEIANFHLALVFNGPTEALNNLINCIKRIGFCLRNFENYRITALLYAGARIRACGSLRRAVSVSAPPCSDEPKMLRG